MNISDIKKYAEEHNVPIIQDGGLKVLKDIIKKYNVEKMIEIGTAIGYSSICFSECESIKKIVTIERDPKMYEVAIKNITLLNKDKIIEQHFGDALEINLEFLSKEYDLLFIDGAKAQSRKFFERYLPFLKEDGVIVVDNISFHGINKETPNISRNVRQLVTKIERFVEWLKNNEEFETVFLEEGDGLAISKRKC